MSENKSDTGAERRKLKRDLLKELAFLEKNFLCAQRSRGMLDDAMDVFSSLNPGEEVICRLQQDKTENGKCVVYFTNHSRYVLWFINTEGRPSYGMTYDTRNNVIPDSLIPFVCNSTPSTFDTKIELIYQIMKKETKEKQQELFEDILFRNDAGLAKLLEKYEEN